MEGEAIAGHVGKSHSTMFPARGKKTKQPCMKRATKLQPDKKRPQSGEVWGFSVPEGRGDLSEGTVIAAIKSKLNFRNALHWPSGEAAQNDGRNQGGKSHAPGHLDFRPSDDPP
jgi:hypothetical protein